MGDPMAAETNISAISARNNVTLTAILRPKGQDLLVVPLL